MKLGFIITCYDSIREVKFTHNMLRNLWSQTKDALISIVISGDPTRSVSFEEDKRTRVTTLDDMVGSKFNELVSTSIAKQIRHGAIELRDLEREFGHVDYVVHIHGDILLLNEQGFFNELSDFAASGKLIAADTVGPQSNDYISFSGREIMPQLFVVKRNFISYLLDMFAPQNEFAKKSTEHMLLENLHHWLTIAEYDNSAHENRAHNFSIDYLFDRYVYEVVKHRPIQWGVHQHFGGWCHFGNQLHFPREIREQRNKAALQAYGIDLSAW